MAEFEIKVHGMGLNKGMFAQSKTGIYISPITRKLFKAYKDGELTALLVNNLLQDLK